MNDPLLILMRHAKSPQAEDGQEDHDRPLNAKGEDACRSVAKYLAQRGWQPEAIWSSDAVRTRQTAETMLAVWQEQGIQTQPQYEPQLYQASSYRILHYAIDRWPEGVRRLMIVAHNPGMTDAIQQLAQEPLEVPTAAAAVFRLVPAEGPPTGRPQWLLDGRAYEAELVEHILPKKLAT